MNSKALLLSAIVLINGFSQASAENYDLVINNGRVMDPETMFDSIANVGIKNGRIAAITKSTLQGDQTIDATGLVVAPGFIDTHFHAVDRFATKLAVRDGVTTGMDLEAGSTRVGAWYAQKDKEGWQINYGTTSSLGLNRMIVHDPEVVMDGPRDASDLGTLVKETAKDGVSGWAVTRSSIDELNRLIELLDEDLRQGAIGIGVGAAYMQRGMTSYEQFEVQRAAARYGRLSSVHTRFHINAQTPNEAPIALDEVLLNAMLLNAPLLLAHDNDYGWWENEEKLKLARKQGFNVWGEYYPFTAGSTVVSAEFLKPSMWEAVNGYKYEETIYDPAADKFLTKAEYLEMVANNPGHMIVVFMPARKEWMKYWLAMPEMVVASDAMMGLNKEGQLLPYEADPSEYAGHPRTGSSYSTTLAMAREQGIPLMFTLSQLSYWNAKHLGDTGLVAMQERGRVQVGKVADLTLFNPKTVTPKATYKLGENGLSSEGIQWVIVNGTIVVNDGNVLDVRPGQSIRFDVEQNPRYVPVNWHEWLDEHTIMPPAFHDTHLDDPRGSH